MSDDAKKLERVWALIRRLDVEMDNDRWLDLFERTNALARSLPHVQGYGIMDVEGGLLLACTTMEQARAVQMTLLMGGVVVSVADRAHYPLIDFCHPESTAEALTARVLAAIAEENAEYVLADADDEEDECDCDECLFGDDCDDCDDCDDEPDDECVCPCARCFENDHEHCTGTPAPAPPTTARPQKPPSKRFLN